MIPYEDLLGKRYEEFADGPDTYNCWGLIRECSRRMGVYLPDLNAVYRGSGLERSAMMLNEVERGWEQVESPEPGLIVLLRVGKVPSHIGFMLDKYRFIHSLEDQEIPGTTDVVVTHRLDSPQWVRKIEGFYRWVGIA